jgi:hypothetical protein
MRTIALISCGKSKRSERAPAHQLYTGALFQKSLAYARHIEADAIYILSAHYGLLDLAQEIAPYEKTLSAMSSGDVARWGEAVVAQLRSRANLTTDRFVILAGLVYRSRLVPHLTNVDLPLDGLRIGKQLQFLKTAVA